MEGYYAKGARVRVNFNATVKEHDPAELLMMIDGTDVYTSFLPEEVINVEPIVAPKPAPVLTDEELATLHEHRSIRLEALKLAYDRNLSAAAIVEAAETFHAFLTKGEPA